MTKTFALIFFVCGSLVLKAQNGTESVPADTVPRLSLSPMHIPIPGTHFWIVPPKGFHFSFNFPGLENAEQETIRFSDIPVTNPRKNPSREGSRAMGKVMDTRVMTISGIKASYTLLQIDPSLMAINLCLEDSSFSGLITATFRAFDEEALEYIKTSLNSLVYDRTKNIPPFDGAFFTMDQSGRLLQLAEDTWDMATFTIGGKIKPGLGEPYATVKYLATDPSTTALKLSDELLAREALLPADQTQVRRIETRIVDERTVLEREIFIIRPGSKKLLYQGVILFPEHAIAFQGYAFSDFGTCIEEFQTLIESIRGKF